MQIRIIDLLAWMTGTSLIMAGYQLFGESEAPNEIVKTVEIISRLILSAIFGAALAGAGFVIARIVRGGKLSPAHWLLLMGAFSIVASFAVWAWYHWGEDTLEFDEQRFIAVQLYSAGVNLLSGMAYLVLSIFLRDKSRWTALFIGFGLMEFLLALLHGLLAWTFWSDAFFDFFDLPGFGRLFTMSIALIWLSIVAALDFRGPPSRDGLHWTGIGVQLASLLFGLINMAWWMWGFPMFMDY